MIDDENTDGHTPLPFGHFTRDGGIAIARTDADFADVRKLWNDYAAWISAAIGVRLIDADPSFGVHLHDPQGSFAAPSAVLVARDRRRAVGTVGLRVSPEGCAELHRLYVAPTSRGLGIGRRLLSASLDLATSLDLDTIDLHTAPEHMPAAVALYRSHGFETLRTERPLGVGVHVMRWRRSPAAELGGGLRGRPPYLTDLLV